MTDIQETGTIVSEELDTTEGTISEDTEVEDTTDVETSEEISTESDQESEEGKDLTGKQKRNAKKVQKLLSDKNELAARVALLERENSIVKLQGKYWEFDTVAVTEIKDNHPSLSWEDALVLRTSKNKTPEQKQFTPSMVGRENSNTDKWFITFADLKKLPTEEYNLKRELIDSGKLKLRN